jgi:hypothetical protein
MQQTAGVLSLHAMSPSSTLVTCLLPVRHGKTCDLAVGSLMGSGQFGCLFVGSRVLALVDTQRLEDDAGLPTLRRCRRFPQPHVKIARRGTSDYRDRNRCDSRCGQATVMESRARQRDLTAGTCAPCASILTSPGGSLCVPLPPSSAYRAEAHRWNSLGLPPPVKTRLSRRTASVRTEIRR